MASWLDPPAGSTCSTPETVVGNALNRPLAGPVTDRPIFLQGGASSQAAGGDSLPLVHRPAGPHRWASGHAMCRGSPSRGPLASSILRALGWRLSHSGECHTPLEPSDGPVAGPPTQSSAVLSPFGGAETGLHLRVNQAAFARQSLDFRQATHFSLSNFFAWFNLGQNTQALSFSGAFLCRFL